MYGYMTSIQVCTSPPREEQQVLLLLPGESISSGHVPWMSYLHIAPLGSIKQTRKQPVGWIIVEGSLHMDGFLMYASR